MTLDNKPELKDILEAVGFSKTPIVFLKSYPDQPPSLIGGYGDLKDYVDFRNFLKTPKKHTKGH